MLKRRKAKGAARAADPRIVERTYYSGFGEVCRKKLAPVKRCGRDVAPNPDCVRRILKDERPSRSMLINIFRNAPELIRHPLTSPAVERLYRDWRAFGVVPDGYGRGNPPKRAEDL